MYPPATMTGGAESREVLGRADLLSLLRQADEARARLLVVTGPPGVGKSALVRAHARAAGENSAWRRGTRVELSGARDAGEVLRRLASAIRIAPVHSQHALVEAVCAALRARGDAVHVLDGADEADDALHELVPRFLDACPDSRFAVTTRARIAVAGERVIDVPPLSAADAEALMLDLATRARAGWTPNAAELRDLTELARRLGGLPLALEIAARWLDLLSPAELLTRFAQLTESSAARVAGPLFDALSGAWEALTPQGRATFAQCSVFAGPFTVEAAEAVVVLDEGSVIDAIAELRRRSLARSLRTDGSVRIAVAFPLRRFARAKLARDSERAVAEAKRRHAELFARSAIAHLDAWQAEGNDRHRKALHEDAAELRAVVARFARSDDAELRALAALALLALEPVYMSTAVPPVLPWLDGAIDACTDPYLRARMKRMRAVMLFHAGDSEGARADLAPLLEQARRDGDARLEAEASLALGTMRAGGRAAAREHLERALSLFASAGLARREAETLDHLGLLALEEGRVGDARDHLLEAVERARRLGDRYEGAYLAHLAFAALESNLLDEAAGWLDAADALGETDYPLARVTIPLRGYLHHLRGELDPAARCYERAVALTAEAGMTRWEALYRGYLGMARWERGDVVGAVRSLEAARESLAARDTEHAALFTAVLGALRATGDTLSEAERWLREAKAFLGSAAGGSFVTAVSALAAHVDLARGDRAAALRRIADAWWSADRRSIDVRLALRTIPLDLRARVEQPGVEAPPALVVHRTGAWMRLPSGEVVELAKKRVGRRLVVELARARIESPGEPIDARELFDRAWEGERVIAEAARNRLHVALSGLRKQGLREYLEAVGDGYRLARELRVTFSDEPLG